MANTPYVTTGTNGNGRKYTLAFPVLLATIADGDIINDYIIDHPFKLIDLRMTVTAAATTPAKLSTLKAYIDDVLVTGSTLALTSANMTPLGKVNSATATDVIAGGANIAYAAGSKISVVASSTTAFIEGSGVIHVTVQNLET
jgi:hypothetical protein